MCFRVERKMKIITLGSLFGAIYIALFFIPNVVYLFIRPSGRAKNDRKLLAGADRLSEACSLVLMVLWFSRRKWGFYSLEEFLWWIVGSAAIILINWILWIVFFIITAVGKSAEKKGGKKRTRPPEALEAVISVMPAPLFLVGGIAQRYVPLLVCAVLFTLCRLCRLLERYLKPSGSREK